MSRVDDSVMVEAGTLLPGDVLLGGEMVVHVDELRATTQHMTVLNNAGKLERVAYGRTFRILRRQRETETRR